MQKAEKKYEQFTVTYLKAAYDFIGVCLFFSDWLALFYSSCLWWDFMYAGFRRLINKL